MLSTENKLFPASSLDDRSYYLRRLVIEALEGGGRGHIGPSMSLIEILRVLYDNYLIYRADEPNWPQRDRCILSKGHGCLALYAILADKGFFSKKELSTFCRQYSILGGHPEKGKVPGIEASTGSLGHGLSIGIGMALAARIRKQNYRVAVIIGDGETNEGSIWEAALACAKHRLSNITVFLDYNKMQCYGFTKQVLGLEPILDKWRSFGFAAVEVDGHDVVALQNLMKSLPLQAEQPTIVVCHTTKGKGLPFAENNSEWHYKHEMQSHEIADMYRSVELTSV